MKVKIKKLIEKTKLKNNRIKYIYEEKRVNFDDKMYHLLSIIASNFYDNNYDDLGDVYLSYGFKIYEYYFCVEVNKFLKVFNNYIKDNYDIDDERIDDLNKLKKYLRKYKGYEFVNLEF